MQLGISRAPADRFRLGSFRACPLFWKRTNVAVVALFLATQQIGKTMSHDHHTKAAALHDAASKSHCCAAEHHSKNDQQSAHEEAIKAHAHSNQAQTASEAALGTSAQPAKASAE